MKKKKLNRKNIILLLVIIVFIISITKIIIFLIDLHTNKNNNKKIIDEVVEKKDRVKEEYIEINFDELLSINSDTVGWIRFNKNKVNNPIVHTKDNSYYLNRSFEKQYNQAGTIFMDYRNNSFDDKNVVLFGHSMIDKTMFGSLGEIFKDGFFDEKENNFIEIRNINNEILIYQIFSYYVIEKEEYYITTSFDNDTSFEKFLNTIKKRSNKKFNIDLSKDDNILTLSTCYGSGGTSKRKVVHAKRVNR